MATQTEANNGNHETELDPIKTGFEIHRGPAQYTHVSLPFVWSESVSPAVVATHDYGFRMTSPYDPFIGRVATDTNTGTGVSNAQLVQNEASDLYTKQGYMTGWYRFYAQMYRYYSVLACRYKITVENNSHEPMMVHAIMMNDVSPPIQASNNDMMLWQGVKSQLVNPKMSWASSSGVTVNEIAGEDFDDDTMGQTQNTAAGSTAYVANPNGQSICVFAGEYRPGDYDNEIHLDEQVSTWTRTNTNPTLREALLLRIKPRDSATAPSAGNASTYGRVLSWNIRVEIEFLCEFKELDSRLRWPVNRNPLGIAINDDPGSVPTGV